MLPACLTTKIRTESRYGELCKAPHPGPAGFWSFGGALAQPIFADGKIKAGVRLSEARQKEMVLTYEQTFQQAFRGVWTRWMVVKRIVSSVRTRKSWCLRRKMQRDFPNCVTAAEPPPTFRC